MIYVFAILLPPLAVLFCGKPFQALINIFLCCIFWLPGVIHAIVVINDAKAKKRHAETLAAISAGRPIPFP